MSIEEKIKELEAIVGGVPGTQIVRVLAEDGPAWSVSCRAMGHPMLLEARGTSIEECIDEILGTLCRMTQARGPGRS